MAILQPSPSNNNPFADQLGDGLPPAGTYPATVLAIKDRFGIERQKFQSDEMETVDLTCFLLGYRDAQGVPHKIASKQMKISGNEKSTLFRFLKSLLGKAPPYKWDYCELKGHRCTLTVEHIQRRDGSGVIASIASVSPLLLTQPAPAPAQPAPPPQGFAHSTPPARPPAPAASSEDDIDF